MNGKELINSVCLPFSLSLSKGERRVFQQTVRGRIGKANKAIRGESQERKGDRKKGLNDRPDAAEGKSVN